MKIKFIFFNNSGKTFQWLSHIWLKIQINFVFNTAGKPFKDIQWIILNIRYYAYIHKVKITVFLALYTFREDLKKPISCGLVSKVLTPPPCTEKKFFCGNLILVFKFSVWISKDPEWSKTYDFDKKKSFKPSNGRYSAL